MRHVRSLPAAIVMAALLLGGVAATPSQPPGGNCDYFPETGHYVCDEFLQFFRTRGELEIFGYPLTEACDDDERGLRVQYFQRARMEWHPYNPDPYRVQLGLLVDELGSSYPAAERIPPFNSFLSHYFPETDHVVSYAFLRYFREKGGLDIFGYPRSESMYEDGYVVQYFQRARMEWHPENPSGSQMRLTNLGEIYLERFGPLKDCGEPLPPPTGGSFTTTPEPPVTELHLSATVRYAFTEREGSQTVFVYATDQRQQPIESAVVTMAVHYPTGDQRYEFESTDASGFTSRSFDILPAPVGQRIVIDVTGTFEDLTSATQTSFLAWW